MKNEDILKEAFERIREDILKVQENIEVVNNLGVENQSKIYSFSLITKDLITQNKNLLDQNKLLFSQLNFLLESFIDLKREVKELSLKVNYFQRSASEKEVFSKMGSFSTTSTHNSTGNQGVSTTSTHNSTDSLPLKPSEGDLPSNSTGNQGVSTDRQTDRQTDISQKNSSYNQEEGEFDRKKGPILKDMVKNLNSLEEIKNTLKDKFTDLTPQEFLVFSTIYQLSLQNESTTYFSLSQKLNLTQSSVRDYVQRLISKGVPLEKVRKNNKNISLSIPLDFQKIAPLSSLLRLRDL